jgi:hypothetical protein
LGGAPTTAPTTASTTSTDEETKPNAPKELAMGMFWLGASGVVGVITFRFYQYRYEQADSPNSAPSPEQFNVELSDTQQIARQARHRELNEIVPWPEMATVASDAPSPEPECAISMEDYADLKEPVRIRQPDGRFTDKVFELSALTIYLKTRLQNPEGFLDPTNRQPFSVKDIFREKQNTASSGKTPASTDIIESKVPASQKHSNELDPMQAIDI